MNRRTKKLLKFLGVIVVIALGVAVYEATAPQGEQGQAGFLAGLRDGIIAPFSLVVSLFSENLRMYEVNNIGAWYDFGFVLGAAALFGGGGEVARD